MKRISGIFRRVAMSRMWFVVALVMVGLSVALGQPHTLMARTTDFVVGTDSKQIPGGFAVICDVSTSESGALIVELSERAPRVVDVTVQERLAESANGEAASLPVFDSSILVSLAESGIQGLFYRWHPSAQIHVHIGDWIVREGRTLEESVAESRHPSTAPDRRIVWRTIAEELRGNGAREELVEQASLAYGRVMLAGTDTTNWDTIRWEYLVLEIMTLISLLSCAAQLVGVRRAVVGRRRLKQGKCPRCQYSLDGLESDACPECGEPISRP